MKSVLRGTDPVGVVGVLLVVIAGTIVVASLLGGCSLHEGERVDVAGVEFEGLAWAVDCDRYPSAEAARIEKRYRDEVAEVYASPACEVGDPTPEGSYVSSVTDCPAYHRTWRNYWAAQRELAACPR